MKHRAVDVAPIFVTGATGYVGGYVLRLAALRPLRCLVRTIPPASPPGVEWVCGDLTQDGAWRDRLQGCEGVLHLATTSLLESERDAGRAEAVVIGGMRRLMDAGIAYDVRRWWIASTMEVYGSLPRLPITEASPLSPASYYGFLKAASDLYATFRAESEGIHCTILRFSNLYGLAADGRLPPTVLRLFAERILRDEPIVLHKSTNNSRDFLHVQDAAAAIWKAIDTVAPSGVINVGSGRETTLKSAGTKLARLAKRRLRIDFRPDEGRQRRVRVDTRRARRVLGFKPSISLKRGLREVLRGATAGDE